jgi:hypothetical protein
MDIAREHDRTLISADTGFGELLARSSAPAPSVILLRRQGNRRTKRSPRSSWPTSVRSSDTLDEGAIVVLDQTRIRIRVGADDGDRFTSKPSLSSTDDVLQGPAEFHTGAA